MREFLRHLIRDEGGAVVVWTSVGLLGFIAIGALVLDAGRVFNMHSQMQAYADHVALAAAAELDGDSQAIARAVMAAAGGAAGPIVTDTQNYAFSGGSALAVTSMTFLSELASGQVRAGELVAGDTIQYVWTGGTPNPTAEQSQLSRFVQVIVAPRNVTNVMGPILAAMGIGGASSTTAVSAAAVAGFTRAACRFPPLMICNPMEDPAGGGRFNAEAMKGRQILMKSQSGGAQWAPGNYGLLDLSDYNTSGCSGGGANLIRCVLGHVNPGTQCVLEGGAVDLKPGNTVGPTRQGMNIRFDMWDPPMQSNRNDPDFAPARNVIKGKTHAPNQCREQNLTETNAPSVPLPRDAGISDAAPIGNGVTLAELQNYWTTNHPTVAWPFPSGVTPTRYDIYRKEIELNPPMNGDESMGPTCAAPVTEPNDMDVVRDRRVLILAVVNCIEHNVRGAMNDVPVEDFAIMFITEPVVDEGSGEGIFGEVLGIVKANASNGVLHEFPVLYR